MALKFWLLGNRELQKSPLSLLHVASTDCLGSVLSLLPPTPRIWLVYLAYFKGEHSGAFFLVDTTLCQNSAFGIIGHR